VGRRRQGQTAFCEVGGARFYLTADRDDDGRLAGVFAKFPKQGSTIAGFTDALSVLISLGLEYGVPLKRMVAELTNTRFEPQGITDDPDIPTATSVVDYLFRRLALDHLPSETCTELGIRHAPGRQPAAASSTPSAAPIAFTASR
jgi:ribonucleoside-diphosphate reductase alpha chain